MISTVETVTSADGTVIAFERTGDGPAVILVGGAFNDRSTVAALAATLASEFTAIGYDRRGRGASGDQDEYSVQREIDDLAALIEQVGGSAHVFGHSSGATLALHAAQQGLPITRLAVYEPPYLVDSSRPRPAADVVDRIQALIDQERRDEAVTVFLTEQVGVPAQAVAGMRTNQTTWGWFLGLAHTLPYDVAICGPGLALPADRLATITVRTLAIAGGESPPWMLAAARAVADTIPDARYLTLEGQDHGVLNQPEALRPILLDFLTYPFLTRPPPRPLALGSSMNSDGAGTPMARRHPVSSPPRLPAKATTKPSSACRCWITTPNRARTRLISPIAAAESGIVPSDSAQSTVSNQASAIGSRFASPSRRSAVRPRSAARCRASGSCSDNRPMWTTPVDRGLRLGVHGIC
jgi:pimeloyl-ACP methyl ester carboxylesterase